MSPDMAGTLRVQGDIEVQGNNEEPTLGDVRVNGKITTIGDVEAGTDVAVQGDVRVNGKITTIGDVEAGTDVAVQGDVRVNGKITTIGDVEILEGELRVRNGDCAEEFDIDGACAPAGPGTVMVLDDVGGVRVSERDYDSRVVGVVSGAGSYKPAMILDHRGPSRNRLPVALMGKVYCKVDATDAPVVIGDLLTTSSTPGHAMKAVDKDRAFGTVIGKALESCDGDRGLIAILVALQ